jgi:DNA-binding YbaB/EbfC family protein
MAKGFGDMGSMMREVQRQTQEMQRRLASLNEDLRQRIVDGTAGGGMVIAYVNGQREIKGIKIKPEVVNPNDVAMLEDMVTAAVAQALKKAAQMYQDEMAKLTGGVSIPGLF